MIAACSFAHKVGVPLGFDLYFDVRGVQSDAYQVPGYAEKTGRDPALAAKLWQDESARQMFDDAKAATVALLLEMRKKKSNSDDGCRLLRVGIGCKSGRHRSVAMVERLRDELKGVCRSSVEHLDAMQRAVSVGNSGDDTNHTADNKSGYPRSTVYTCLVCKVDLSTANDMNIHLRGKRHQKRVAKQIKRRKTTNPSAATSN
jgi:hypothetical protein